MNTDTLTHIRLLRPAALLTAGVTLSGTPAVQDPSADRSAVPTLLAPVLRNGTEEVRPEAWGWTVDGLPLAVAWDEGYALAASGQLTLTRNFAAGEYHTLRCSAVYGRHEVFSDDLLCGCSTQGTGTWRASCSHSRVLYDARSDARLLYDYLSANSLPATPPAEGAKSYLLRATLLLCAGSTPMAALPEGVRMEVRRGESVCTSASFSAAWLLKADYPDLWMDLRLIDSLQADVLFLKGETELARTTVSIRRKMHPRTTLLPAAGYDLTTDAGSPYTDRATLYDGAGLVDHPELHYDLTWTNDNSQTLGYGEQIHTTAARIGLVEDEGTARIELQGTERGALAPATDGDGAYLTDEQGRILII